MLKPQSKRRRIKHFCILIMSHGEKMECLVDWDDLQKIAPFHWNVGNDGYARATSHGRSMTMHRMLSGAKKGDLIDHLNRNKLDNRKANLRFCSPLQNTLNQPLLRRDNKSGYRGVTIQHSGRFCAKINDATKYLSLGTYDTAEEAAVAYDRAAIRIFGKEAQLNILRP